MGQEITGFQNENISNVETQGVKNGHHGSSRRIKTREGLVVSDKMSKTVVVAVKRQVPNTKYRKYVRRTNKIMAHDEQEICNVGDLVEIVEGKPISKNKSWKVARIVRKKAE